MNTWRGEVQVNPFGPKFIAMGFRSEDDTAFAETGISREAAKSNLDLWLNAPLKSADQSFEEYVNSKEYKDYGDKVRGELDNA